MSPLRKRAALADGGVSYLEWPGEGPTLVFLHATGFNAETYKTLLAPLAGDARIIAIDQRGHGFSSLPTAPGLSQGWTVFRDDLIAFLGAVGGAPAILSGHSMGGTVCLMTAAVPDRVRALVLLEPVLVAANARSERSPGPDLADKALVRRSNFPSREAAIESYSSRGIFKAWPGSLVADYVNGGLVHQNDGSWRLACAPEWESECFRNTPLGIASVARDARCPISILHGTINSTTWASETTAISALHPDARVLPVDGASHFLPMEHPEIIRAEILRSLKLVEP